MWASQSDKVRYFSRNTDHGLYEENRKFLSSIHAPPTISLHRVFTKVSQPHILPINCDLRPLMGPTFEVYNQGGLGSCTANAIAHAYKIMTRLKYNRDVSISRLFVYYNERAMIGKVHEDSGAFINHGFTRIMS